MTPQRRTALISVAAAAALVALKVGAGLATGSLGLISEALHSGTDLVAALLTFFALGVAGRAADPEHPYGHGKAEHLAALAEAAILVAAAVLIAARAFERLVIGGQPEIDAAWYAFVVLGIVIVVDASRALVSFRAARRYGSPALAANALHFASDLAGSMAVVIGLAAAAVGYHRGDSAAALFVAVLVLAGAARLIRANVDVLMDRTPIDAHAAARRAIRAIHPPVELRRLRVRQAAGRHFADVVIGVPPGAAVGQGHAAADAVEDAVQRVLPESDVVVHVEPEEAVASVRERALAAALRVPRVREVHNVNVVRLDGRSEVSLHLKLPGDLPLEEAHAVATEVERAIVDAVPEVDAVETHLEPLGEGRAATEVVVDRDEIWRLVEQATGRAPRRVRLLRTGDGVVAYVTLAVEPITSLAEAHELAGNVEREIRRRRPEIADVIVHTEP